jgi:hypothetical protein
VLDAHDAQTNSFRCADCMQIELKFQLDEPVDRPLIQYSLCDVNGKVYSGPIRSSWALRFQGLPLGVTSIASSPHYLFSLKIVWYTLAWRVSIPLIRSYRSIGSAARSALPLLEETHKVLLGA